MKKISLVIHNQKNNEIFDADNISINRDNCMSAFHQLKADLKNKGYDLSTCDINNESESNVSLYFDLNQSVDLVSPINYLILQESEVINPFGWTKSLHNHFDRVYTWNDDLVDDIKYFKLNFSHLFPSEKEWKASIVHWTDKKLCTLIAGNKSVHHPLELYSERVNAIKWFEKNTSKGDFEFYGVGWDKPQSANRYINYLLKKMTAIHFLFHKYKSYKGSVQSKNETLKGYRFAICFENAKEIPGYITEKIFDCFFAGCVPIYLGAPNISEHIPNSCYVDFSEFDSYDELYQYLLNMNQNEYDGYINSIQNYIFSARSSEYSSVSFSEILLGHITCDVV